MTASIDQEERIAEFVQESVKHSLIKINNRRSVVEEKDTGKSLSYCLWPPKDYPAGNFLCVCARGFLHKIQEVTSTKNVDYPPFINMVIRFTPKHDVWSMFVTELEVLLQHTFDPTRAKSKAKEIGLKYGISDGTKLFRALQWAKDDNGLGRLIVENCYDSPDKFFSPFVLDEEEQSSSASFVRVQLGGKFTIKCFNANGKPYKSITEQSLVYSKDGISIDVNALRTNKEQRFMWDRFLESEFYTGKRWQVEMPITCYQFLMTRIQEDGPIFPVLKFSNSRGMTIRFTEIVYETVNEELVQENMAILDSFNIPKSWTHKDQWSWFNEKQLKKIQQNGEKKVKKDEGDKKGVRKKQEAKKAKRPAKRKMDLSDASQDLVNKAIDISESEVVDAMNELKRSEPVKKRKKKLPDTQPLSLDDFEAEMQQEEEEERAQRE